MNIFKTIKEKRESLGFSQKEFANKIGLTLPSYRNYEQGVTSPNLPTLTRICKALGFSEFNFRNETIK